ncbi:hypothetical protein [Mycobacterium sp. E1319]|uniref:hypothetical protein n=1 Tax=Mycobacterium sp. E1319 TaxID=1834124 RepID=UPI000A71D053|nr:hypothetical protein [Mycobacterium sp. E1319]
MPQSGPDADEIVVDRVKAFRFAERNGTFDGIHAEMNTPRFMRSCRAIRRTSHRDHEETLTCTY